MNDPLLDKIKATKKRMEAESFIRRKTTSGSFSGQTEKNVTIFYVFWYQVVRSLTWLYFKFVRPVMAFFWKPVKWLWHQYRVLWDKVVYEPDEFGVIRFSKVRGGLMIVATTFMLWITPNILDFFTDVIMYTVTAKKNEVVYMTNSQEILPALDIHSAQGCDDLPCTDQNSIYFRIRPKLFNELWSIAHNGNIFFPDYVGAAIPSAPSKCTITVYGIRVKFLMKDFDIYPDLLEASCMPVVSDHKGMP